MFVQWQLFRSIYKSHRKWTNLIKIWYKLFMRIKHNIDKYKNLTNYELKKQQSLILIAANIEKSLSQLSLITKLSVSTVKRYKKIIKSNQEIDISHKNKNQQRSCKVTDSEIELVFKDYLKTCEIILNSILTNNQLSFKSYYYSEYGSFIRQKISYKTLVRRFNQLGLFNIHTTKRGRKIAKLSKKKTSQEITLLLKKYYKQIKQNEKQRQVLGLKKNLEFGEIVEIDAQLEPYLKNNKPFYLYHAIDVATGTLLAAWFEEQETTLGYQRLLEIVFKKYGFPKKIYTDKRRTFWGNENAQTIFEKDLNKKGIEVLSSSNPKHKPHVERSFRTSLDQYPLLIHENGYKDINDLKQNNEVFQNYYNTRNKKIISKHNVFQKEGKKNGNWAVDLEINRKVLNGVVRYQGKNLAAFDMHDKRIIFPYNSDVVLVHSSDDNLYFKYNGKKYFAKEPKGKYLSFTEMWALEKGLDYSIPAVGKLAFIHKKTNSFFKTLELYISKFNSVSVNAQGNNLEANKIMAEYLEILRTLHRSINDEIKIDAY
ncbi:transposase [Mycoplasmopsis bovirhinis]|nr:transposase [Mycoplasmopsis bovirhinis]